MTAGYSGTPLARKLGIGVDAKVLTIGAPVDLEELLAPMPKGVQLSSRFRTADVVLVFAIASRDMERGVARARRAIAPDGTIWLCWPKKASGIPSDLQTRDTVMEYMLPLGLVDVKVAAISEVWSGLKFVIRKELR